MLIHLALVEMVRNESFAIYTITMVDLNFYWLINQLKFYLSLISVSRYFETLQKGLEYYDIILYEMVASREILENRRNSTSTKRLKASRSKGFNILGFIQRQMARILSLDFQLDCLDYDSENWLHADLDYETFKLLQVNFHFYLPLFIISLFHFYITFYF